MLLSWAHELYGEYKDFWGKIIGLSLGSRCVAADFARPRLFREGAVASCPTIPHALLTAALEPWRNRDAAFALAVFLARLWSTPSRIIDAFPIDRREFGLTEDTVPGRSGRPMRPMHDWPHTPWSSWTL
jgi:hypothetical protein